MIIFKLQSQFFRIHCLCSALRPPIPPPFTEAFSRVVCLLGCDVFIHVLRHVLQRAVEDRAPLWTETMIQRVGTLFIGRRQTLALTLFVLGITSLIYITNCDFIYISIYIIYLFLLCIHDWHFSEHISHCNQNWITASEMAFYILHLKTYTHVITKVFALKTIYFPAFCFGHIISSLDLIVNEMYVPEGSEKSFCWPADLDQQLGHTHCSLASWKVLRDKLLLSLQCRTSVWNQRWMQVISVLPRVL